MTPSPSPSRSGSTDSDLRQPLVIESDVRRHSLTIDFDETLVSATPQPATPSFFARALGQEQPQQQDPLSQAPSYGQAGAYPPQGGYHGHQGSSTTLNTTSDPFYGGAQGNPSYPGGFAQSTNDHGSYEDESKPLTEKYSSSQYK